MNKKITLIQPRCQEEKKAMRLNSVLDYALEGYEYELLETAEEAAAADLHGRLLLFAVELGESGINLEYVKLLKSMRLNRNMFEECLAGLVVDGNSELFTKSVARHMVFSANRAGCAFPGRPLVEGTRTLRNFNIIAKNLGTDNATAYKMSVRDLVERVSNYEKRQVVRPKILALHAGIPETSNTLLLWDMIRRRLDADLQVISLRNGELHDCRACSYETCLHFGEQSKCFYGGVISEDVYPAVLDCDGLIMICPNYNDAVGANLTAFSNRLTALVRTHNFSDKRLYAVIVSGYSGSDIVAEQLISALNMNKTFYLPPRFAMMRIANDPGSIVDDQHIREDAAAFAKAIMDEFNGA